jgi:electron transfer flavoprotein alpha subunit
VKLDRTVLTNNVDVAVDGGAVTVTTPIFGGNTLVTTKFSGAGRTSRRSARRASPPSPPVAARPRSGRLRVPELGATGAAPVTAVHVEASTGPKLDEAAVVVSGGRGLGEADKYQLVESSRSCSRVRRVRRVRSSTPAGCPTATRSARPARS